MGLFHSNYNKPGPGVSKDAPRAKGLKRFWEIISRDFYSLWRANLLLCLVCLPVMLGVLFSQNVFLLALVGAVGGALMGPFLCALQDTILRALRDEPGFWWHRYKTYLKKNWKETLLPGILYGLVVVFQIYMILLIIDGAETLGMMTLILLIDLLFTTMIFTFLFPQIVLLELPFGTVLKNSLLLAVGNAPRALAAAILQLIYWGVMLLFFPVSLYWMLFGGFWIIHLASLQIIYPVLNNTFHIEERLRAQQEQAESDEPGGRL